jgi:hypothetical protein
MLSMRVTEIMATMTADSNVATALREAAIQSYIEEMRRRAASGDVLTFQQVMERIHALGSAPS